ncbi:MAG: hypothetical protein PQJ59_16790 [Spirochaetales bacterium]|nr:hypothetical protein [Spirochaetales bacterium]
MMKYSLLESKSNAFSIIGYVTRCMKKEGLTEEDCCKYRGEATAGDYHELVAVSQKMIDKLNGEEE